MDLREIPESLRDGYNATGSDIASSVFVTGQEDSVTLTAATTDAIYGLTRSAGIKTHARGSVMLRGRGICQAGTGGVTKGQRIMPEAATGKGITWTTGHSIGGVAMTTAAADAFFEIELCGPGITNQ